MDAFSRAEILELIEADTQPAISIYMPIEYQNRVKKAIRLQFRSLVDQAATQFKESGRYDTELYMPLLDRLYEHVEDAAFWLEMDKGLAVFIAPDFERIYRLPTAFSPLSVVAPNFHTRPLMKYLSTPQQYWILAVGQNEVNLWEGTAAGVRPIDLETLPDNLQDALLLDIEGERVGTSFRGTASRFRGSGASRSNPSPVFQSSGGGSKEEQKAWIREYFSQVDNAVLDYLRGKNGPVVLAGVDYLHPLYRAVTNLPNLAEQGIEGNIQYLNHAEIHQRAWPIIEKEIARQYDSVLALWERAYGLGNAEMDIANIARLVLEGRVHMLMIDAEQHLWGQIDWNSGAVTFLKENGSNADLQVVDLLDELAEQVLALGGQVCILSNDKMPSSTGAAAILRGSERYEALPME